MEKCHRKMLIRLKESWEIFNMATRMIPRSMIDGLRKITDVILGAIGMDCTLYIPTISSYNTAEKLDVFATPTDYSYSSYSAKIFINWSPSTYRLKKLGLFVEDTLPILVWFGNKATALDGENEGSMVSIDPCRKSYFRINPEFVPESYEDVEEFELVNIAIKGFQDAVVRKIWSSVPRRVEL